MGTTMQVITISPIDIHEPKNITEKVLPVIHCSTVFIKVVSKNVYGKKAFYIPDLVD